MKTTLKKTLAALIAVAIAMQVTATYSLSVESFKKAKLLVPVDSKIRETDVNVLFEQRRMVIRSKDSGMDLKVFAYKDITSAEYSYSNHPRWKSGAGAAVAVGVFALPIFFMKGKKHWLSIKAGNDFAVIRLDKGNYKVIVPAFETHTKVKVESVGEEK